MRHAEILTYSDDSKGENLWVFSWLANHITTHNRWESNTSTNTSTKNRYVHWEDSRCIALLLVVKSHSE